MNLTLHTRKAPHRRRLRGVPFIHTRLRPAPLAMAAILGLTATACRGPESGEVPAWVSSRFVRLHGVAAPAPATELWVAPVQMGCPHCIETVARVERERIRREGVRTAALIVGGRAPRKGLAQVFQADEVWWDRSGIWRRAWNRDDHGIVLVFDAQGRFVADRRTGVMDHELLAEQTRMASQGQGVPPDDR